MRHNLTEHIISVLFIAVLFGAVAILLSPSSNTNQVAGDRANALNFINPDDPLQKLMLKESLHFFYSGETARNDSILQIISQGSGNIFVQRASDKVLDWDKGIQIIFMYLKFIIVFVIVLILTYYGAQSLAILKFVKMQQNKSSYLLSIHTQLRSDAHTSYKSIIVLLVKAIMKGMIYLVLFSPAYVIAYSFKTRFDTDSIFFMILLGIISNGLLISYTQKFYTFLLAESRKGYVRTARVKNLSNNYLTNKRDGLRYHKIFRINKSFDGHVFQHIYKNARFQFISSIKEQASFLISGLVIIEMALNIQGHLCYELLQNILYQNFQVVLLIIFLIFLLLKLTEIYCDYLQYHFVNKYENIAGSQE